MSSYMNREEFERTIGISNLISNEFILYQIDNYDESKLMEKLKESGKMETYVSIAIQLSIVGYGKKTYGKILLEEDYEKIRELKENEGVLDLKKYGTEISELKELNIVYPTENDQVKEDTITINRLIRFFRFHVQQYILKTGKASYLYKNYAPYKKKDYELFIYRGSEYCVPLYTSRNNLKEDEGDSKGRTMKSIEKQLTKSQIGDILTCLIVAYKNIDRKYGIDISERIKRVLMARGLTEEEYDFLCFTELLEESDEEENEEERKELSFIGERGRGSMSKRGARGRGRRGGNA